MGAGRRFAIPDGWVARGFRFEVEPTSPEQPARIAQHFGARRHAHNWALEQVKANLEARRADPAVPPLAWNFYELRRTWNQTKHQVAPWWWACSKARHRDRGRVRFSTGALRLEPDRRHLTLPVVGRLRSKENTRRLERLVAKGRARVLSMTLAEQGERLFVSVQAIVAHQPIPSFQPHGRS